MDILRSKIWIALLCSSIFLSGFNACNAFPEKNDILQIQKQLTENVKSLEKNKEETELLRIGHAIVCIDQKTKANIASGQIAKVFETVKTEHLKSNRLDLFIEFKNALRKEFGDHSFEKFEYGPADDEKTLKDYKGMFIGASLEARENNEYLHYTKPTKQVAREGKMVELYFRNLFKNRPELDIQTIVNLAMETLAKVLQDKYAAYYSNQQSHETYAKTINDSTANINGEFQIYDPGDLYITEIVKGDSLDLSGFQIGDQIISIDGKKIQGEEEFLKLYPPRENVIIKIKRKNQELSIPYRIVKRAQIPIVSAQCYGKTGVVQIQTFGKKTSEEFKKALIKLRANSIERIVIDLRNNVGGNNDALSSTMNLLMKNRNIASFVYGNGKKIKWHIKGTCDHEINIPIVVLTNELTASCSEVMTAALKDHFRAKIVGENTRGKGVAQVTILGPIESYFKFTNCEVITSNDASYHGKGLSPDYYSSLPIAQELAALRMAGETNFDIEVRDLAVSIHKQLPVSGFKILGEKGKRFFPIEFLAAPFLVKWNVNQAKGKICVQNLQGKNCEIAYIEPAEDFYYASLQEFCEAFPELVCEEGADQVSMQINF